MKEGPCCAHKRVVNRNDETNGRVTREWWECEGCGAKFKPDGPVLANRSLRMHIALTLMRAWNYGTNGFDSSVVMVINKWFDDGMQGPVPWPDGPFFAEWAGKHGYSNIGGFVGFRFEVSTPPTEPEAPRASA